MDSMPNKGYDSGGNAMQGRTAQATKQCICVGGFLEKVLTIMSSKLGNLNLTLKAKTNKYSRVLAFDRL